MASQPRQPTNRPIQDRPVDEAPYGILIEEDMIDDSTGIIPTRGLGVPLSLKDRFVRRLSKMLGAEANIREVPNGNAMDIFLTRGKQSPWPSVTLDDGLRKFVRDLEDALTCVARETTGSPFSVASGDLWDVILVSNYNKMEQVIHSLRNTFEENQSTFDELVTRLFGINDLDDEASPFEYYELGDRIITLSQSTRGFNGSMKEINLLVQFASKMAREFIHLQTQLRSLLEKTRFADKLYELICTLGFPERVHSTLVRSARTLPMFRNVRIHHRPDSPGKSVSFATPLAKTTRGDVGKTCALPPKEKSKRIQRHEATAIGVATVTPVIRSASASASSPSSSLPPPSLPPPLPLLLPLPPQPAATNLGPLMTTAQPYLAQKDRNLALTDLQPATKQAVTQLIGTVLRSKLLPMQKAAWYAFGFVTMKDEEQERTLAGLYAAILKEAPDRQAIFHDLQTALENGKIVDLIDKYQYSHFRQLFPYLQTFLATPPTKRSTVWRLREFLLDPVDDEPPACLQRDYGFRYCRQREEVLRLKVIYTNMLRNMGPKELHIACVNGRLAEAAMKEGVVVAVKDKRFLKNDYGSPFLGTDCEGGLEAYRGPFYRKNIKL